MACFSKSVVLEIYADFINNFSEAMDLAKLESKRKSAFGDFLKVIKQELLIHFEIWLTHFLIAEGFKIEGSSQELVAGMLELFLLNWIQITDQT